MKQNDCLLLSFTVFLILVVGCVPFQQTEPPSFSHQLINKWGSELDAVAMKLEEYGYVTIGRTGTNVRAVCQAA